MSNNIFMAMSTAVLNAAALTLTRFFEDHNVAQVMMALASLASPFLSIWLLKLYIRSDDPPELTRIISSLNSSIKVCQKHLNDKSISQEFRDRTQSQIEMFRTKLQNARADFENGRTHAITPISADPPS